MALSFERSALRPNTDNYALAASLFFVVGWATPRPPREAGSQSRRSVVVDRSMPFEELFCTSFAARCDP
jgi:hypothetical protein